MWRFTRWKCVRFWLAVTIANGESNISQCAREKRKRERERERERKKERETGGGGGEGFQHLHETSWRAISQFKLSREPL